MMTEKLLLLFFGLPLAILGMGMRRALGTRGFLAMLTASTIAGIYGVFLEAALHRIGHGLPLPLPGATGPLREFALYSLGAAMLGSLGALLIRYQGRGSFSSDLDASETEADQGKPEREKD